MQQIAAMDKQLVQMDIERKIAQLPLYDRYIVKLKMSEAAVFSNETPMESIGANIDAAIPAAKSTANEQVRAVLSEKQVEETALFDLTTTPTYTVEEQSPALLTVSLSQKVDAAAFTAELANNAQIEYIQPDYALELASDVVLNLDLSELEPAETAAPAATGALEIDMEITPEQTPAAGVATVPETELEPAVTPTPTLPEGPATAPVVGVMEIETGSMPVLQVPIDVDKIGTYAVWMRSRVNTDAQDSIWMNVDGGTYSQRILEISSYDEQAQYNMYG